MGVPADFIVHYSMDNIVGSALKDEAGVLDLNLSGASFSEGAIKNQINLVSNAYASGSSAIIEGNTEGTIAFWVDADVGSGNRGTITIGKQAGTAAFLIGLNSSNQIRVYSSTQSSINQFSLTGNTAISSGRHLITFSSDGESHRMTVDGKEQTLTYTVGSNNGKWFASTGISGGVLELGRLSRSDGPYYYSSGIDELRIYDRSLTLDEIRDLFREKLIIPEDYVTHYTMDNIDGSTIKDEAGVHNGTITGATVIDGLNGSALSFDGDNDFINCNTEFNFVQVTNKFTISMFVKMADIAEVHQLMGTNPSTGANGFWLEATTSGSFKFYFFASQSNIQTSSSAIEVGEYQHLVITGDGTNNKILVNLEQLASGSLGTRGAAPRDCYLGAGNYNGTHFGKCIIDNFYIYDRDLTENELAALYIEGAIKLNLIAHYTMDNIDGTTIYDETGNYDTSIMAGITQVDGYLGSALSFSGAGTAIDVPSITAALGNNFTISCWVNPDAYGAYYGMWGAHIGSPANGVFGFQDNGSSYDAGWFNNGTINYGSISYADIPLNKWTNLILRCTNGTDLDIFVNASNKVSQSGVTIQHNASFYIGTAYGGSGSRFFPGQIDQFRVYNRAINEAEIQNLFYEQLLTKILQGTITETLSIINWLVRCYRLDTGLLTGETETIDGTFTIDVGLENDAPHMVTVIPDQGIPWKRNITKAIGDLVYPTDPSTAPYYFKATTTGATGDTEPPWVTTPGQTVVDNGVTWECVERLVQPITHSPLMPV